MNAVQSLPSRPVHPVTTARTRRRRTTLCPVVPAPASAALSAATKHPAEHPATSGPAPCSEKRTRSAPAPSGTMSDPRGHRRGTASAEDPDLGATTAEYGIVMLAAVGFAGLLVVILKSGEVRELLMGIVRSALSMG